LSGASLALQQSLTIVGVSALALALHMQEMFQKSSCYFERNEKNMNTVLQLQKLMPTASTGEISVLFISTYSNICPTTGLPGEAGKFEMQ